MLFRSRSNQPFTHVVYGALDTSESITDAIQNLVSEGRGTSIALTISIPDAAEECPITSLSMSDPSGTDDLHFLEADCRVFDRSRPMHTKATLPCGHSFSVLHLLYYWCKQNMRCPCCRDGIDNLARTDCLPYHVRHDMAQRIETLRREEAQELLEDDRRAATLVATAIDFGGAPIASSQLSVKIGRAHV